MKISNILSGLDRNLHDRKLDHLRDSSSWHYYDVDVDIMATMTLSAISVGTEAAALRLAERPHTVKNDVGRAACQGIAIGSAYLAAKFGTSVLEQFDHYTSSH